MVFTVNLTTMAADAIATSMTEETEEKNDCGKRGLYMYIMEKRKREWKLIQISVTRTRS